MAPSVFVDTAHFVALFNTDDRYREPAQRWAARIRKRRTPRVTTEYVLVELADSLSRLRFRSKAVEIVRAVLRDPPFQVVPASSELFSRSLALFDSRSDKEWGLTDCASFVTMQERALNDALTCDAHFTQAGFRVLLLDDPDKD